MRIICGKRSRLAYRARAFAEFLRPPAAPSASARAPRPLTEATAVAFGKALGAAVARDLARRAPAVK